MGLLGYAAPLTLHKVTGMHVPAAEAAPGGADALDMVTRLFAVRVVALGAMMLSRNGEVRKAAVMAVLLVDSLDALGSGVQYARGELRDLAALWVFAGASLFAVIDGLKFGDMLGGRAQQKQKEGR